jgi:hypothetical protein
LARLHQALRAGFRVRAGIAGSNRRLAPHGRNLRIEDFDRFPGECGNKSAVNQPLIAGRVAIFVPLSTARAHGINLGPAPLFGIRLFAGAEGTCAMRQLRLLLRFTPSRIGRRLALIVAIAAASLPAAGA